MAAPRPNTLTELSTAIGAVVDYLWEPEMDNYKENRRDMGEPEAHIFHTLVALNNWVLSLSDEPDALIEYKEEEDDEESTE